MTFLTKGLLLKFTLVIILCEPHFAEGEVNCVQHGTSDQQGCIFTGILTNETHPHFIPFDIDLPSLDVTSVAVQHSKIPVLTDELCDMFRGLRKLEIKNNSVKRIQDEALSFCKDLNTFIISENDLTKVSPKLFVNNPKLL